MLYSGKEAWYPKVGSRYKFKYDGTTKTVCAIGEGEVRWADGWDFIRSLNPELEGCAYVLVDHPFTPTEDIVIINNEITSKIKVSCQTRVNISFHDATSGKQKTYQFTISEARALTEALMKALTPYAEFVE